MRIGLVTSIGSAAHADFLSELRRANYGFEVSVVHASVQGPSAPAEIVAALAALRTRHPEIVAVVRGGGAQTDLAAFDTELVALAVADAPFPVFVGIGHEIDATVIDEVAAASFKTPTACAAAIVAAVRVFDERVAGTSKRLVAAVRTGLAGSNVALLHRASRVRLASRRTLTDAERQLRRWDMDLRRAGVMAPHHAMRRVTIASDRIARAAQSRLGFHREVLVERQVRLIREAPRRLTEAQRRLAAVESIVRAHEPDRMLQRGWSITRTGDGRLVRDPTTVSGGDHLVTAVAGGAIHSEVRDPTGHRSDGDTLTPDRAGPDPVGPDPASPDPARTDHEDRTP